MSLADFKGWNIDQAKARYKELKKEIFELRVKAGMNQLTDSAKIEKAKKELARLLTYAKKQDFKNIR